MGIFGMIAGGSLGLFVGGPIGAVLGGVLGSKLGDVAPVLSAWAITPSRESSRAAFALGLTCLAAKVSQSDGEVSQDEIAAFDGFLRDRLGLSLGERESAARVFNAALTSKTPASEYALQLGRLFRSKPDRLRDIVTILFSVAHADGTRHDDEEELIRRIARDMGLSSADYRTARASFRSARGDAEVSPYDVLGVSRDATDAEVRSAHRRIVREYHPDVLVSKGLPVEFLQFAKQKLVSVNESWAEIKAERGNLSMPD